MSDKSQNIIDETQKYLMKTYTSQPVVMDRGEGAYAWDTDGKKYLDFACGIAVASLGHAHPAILKTLQEQAAKMMTCQSSYATEPKLAAAKKLVENSCFDQVYFSNSGTESIEAAMKLVRKWAYDNKSKDAVEIIAFRKSFHGRTYGAASITEKRHSQPFFEPYLPGIHFATFNDLESVKELISDKTCAIFVEPVQGEGGVMPANPCFLKGLRDLCDEHNIILVFDEVQAGMGRVGTLFAYESFKCCGNPAACGNGANPGADAKPIEPDMAALAKGMGGGFPVGALVAKNKFADAMVVGVHGTTYGGNPLACAVANTVIGELAKPEFLENVRKVGKVFMDGLKDLQRESNKIKEIRGMGLMVGLDTSIEVKKMMKALQNNGLLTTQAGEASIRLTPPLIINEQQAQDAVAIIGKTLKEEE
jgi:predicted acetylornithine/succinylornithine family transaminase